MASTPPQLRRILRVAESLQAGSQGVDCFNAVIRTTPLEWRVRQCAQTLRKRRLQRGDHFLAHVVFRATEGKAEDTELLPVLGTLR